MMMYDRCPASSHLFNDLNSMINMVLHITLFIIDGDGLLDSHKIQVKADVTS